MEKECGLKNTECQILAYPNKPAQYLGQNIQEWTK